MEGLEEGLELGLARAPVWGAMIGERGRREGRYGSLMIERMLDEGAVASLWQQLVLLWELIVMVCRFLWGLLRLLGGG
jgi:hypothetical protein